MTIKAKLSTQVANQFPEFYKEDGQNFLAFIEGYYEYLEQNGKLSDAIQNLEDYKDINTTLDQYLTHFQETLLPSVPHDVLSDKRLMAKYVKYYNETRGSLASYKLLFRAIYNEDVEVNYPADQMLKLSDGDWQLDRYLVTNYNQKNYSFIGKTIVGTESNAQALVEDVVGRVIRGRDLMQINVSNIKGTFNHLEPIRLLSDTNGSGHSAIVDAGIHRIEIVSPGANYKAGDVVKLESDKIGDFGKVVVTDTVDLNGSLTFTIIDGGSGYTAVSSDSNQGGTVVSISGGDGDTAASFTISGSDLSETFAIATNVTLLGANNIFGFNGPPILNADYSTREMSTFANTIIGSPTLGFRESNEVTNNGLFRDNEESSLHVANTLTIGVGASLYGVSSGANATVTAITDATDGAGKFTTDGYRKFITSIRNRVNYSEQLDNAYWDKTRCAIANDTSIAPDGAATADKIVEDGSDGTHFIDLETSFLQNSTQYTTSVFLKTGSTTRNAALIFATNSAFPAVKVNLQNGTIVSTAAGLTSTIKSVGNGWHRVTMTGTTHSSGTHNIQLNITDDSNVTSYQGDASKHIFAWGFQVETAAAATEYQRVVADAFGTGETLLIVNTSGSSAGKVTSFAGNTTGYHILDVANTGGQTVALGDEIVSTTNFYADNTDTTFTDTASTGEEVYSYGVVKKVISTTPYLYEHNTTANVVQSNTVSSSSNNVTSTNIGTVFGRGDVIKAGGQPSRRVVSITDDNTIVVTPAFSPALSGAAYGKGGVFRHVVKCRVSANNSANVSNQFDFGPLQGFVERDGVRKVGSTAIIGNVHFSTSNTELETVYSKLEDSLVFKTLTFGSIDQLSSRVGGSGFTVAPKVDVTEPGIGSLGIGEQFLTIQSSTESNVTVDTNDGIVQSSSGASGDVKAGASYGAPTVTSYSNGQFETIIRIWQPPLQRFPNGKTFANNTNATIRKFSSSYVAGTLDTRSVDSTATVKIVKVDDRGILGQNANIRGDVGANGTITGLRVADSGFSHEQNEEVRVQDTGREDSTQAVVRLRLQNAANSEGYYATSRSHISTKRGFIQDSNFYQEFSYEVAVPLSLKRYKDIAMKLAHPAGQKMFGKFKSHSNTNVNVSLTSNNTFRKDATGTFTFTEGSFGISGSGTAMESQFANGGVIIIKKSAGVYYKVPLNIVTNDTTANAHIAWANSTFTTTAQYTTGSIG
jgi:hypothetical protein